MSYGVKHLKTWIVDDEVRLRDLQKRCTMEVLNFQVNLKCLSTKRPCVVTIFFKVDGTIFSAPT